MKTQDLLPLFDRQVKKLRLAFFPQKKRIKLHHVNAILAALYDAKCFRAMANGTRYRYRQSTGYRILAKGTDYELGFGLTPWQAFTDMLNRNRTLHAEVITYLTGLTEERWGYLAEVLKHHVSRIFFDE